MAKIPESRKMTLEECKHFFRKKGLNYTDEQVSAVRDWLYFHLELTVDFVRSKSDDELEGLLKMIKSEKT